MKPSLSLPAYPSELEDWWWNQAFKNGPNAAKKKSLI